jgi:hypothetical protein
MNKSRSKRGGWNFPWSEIETFKKKLREISNINDAMIDANTANNYTLSDEDKTEIVEKLGGYFNSLTDEDRSKLNEQLHNAEKNVLYTKVYNVLQQNRMKNTPEIKFATKSQVADLSYTSSQPTSPEKLNPSAKVMRTGTTNFNPGFKNSNNGGKSRRRRHSRRRRTNKNRKSRKGRKMRRSYK